MKPDDMPDVIYGTFEKSCAICMKPMVLVAPCDKEGYTNEKVTDYCADCDGSNEIIKAQLAQAITVLKHHGYRVVKASCAEPTQEELRLGRIIDRAIKIYNEDGDADHMHKILIGEL